MIRFSKINGLPPHCTQDLRSRFKGLLEHDNTADVMSALRGYLAPTVRLSFESLQGVEINDRFRIVFLHNDQRWEELISTREAPCNKTQGMSIRVVPDEELNVLLYEETEGVFKLKETRQFDGIDLLQTKIFIYFPERALGLTLRVAVDIPSS